MERGRADIEHLVARSRPSQGPKLLLVNRCKVVAPDVGLAVKAELGRRMYRNFRWSTRTSAGHLGDGHGPEIWERTIPRDNDRGSPARARQLDIRDLTARQSIHAFSSRAAMFRPSSSAAPDANDMSSGELSTRLSASATLSIRFRAKNSS
jgi:hypothetical protein